MLSKYNSRGGFMKIFSSNIPKNVTNIGTMLILILLALIPWKFYGKLSTGYDRYGAWTFIIIAVSVIMGLLLIFFLLSKYFIIFNLLLAIAILIITLFSLKGFADLYINFPSDDEKFYIIIAAIISIVGLITFISVFIDIKKMIGKNS